MNLTRLKNLLLYLANKYVDDFAAGKKRLHKVLFFADVEAYRRSGKTITDLPFVKNHYGPFLGQVDHAVQQLESNGAAHWVYGQAYEPIRLVAKKKADMSAFTEEEVAILDEMIETYRNWPGSAVEAAAQSTFAYKSSRHGRAIPYDTYHVGDPRPLTQDENAWALDVIERYRERKRSAQEYCP